MNPRNKPVDIVKAAAESAAAAYECRLIDLSFKREKDGTILKVIVDSETLTLDTCANISSKFSEWLDAHEKDIPFRNYTLEVSSPGPERKLTSKSDFEKFLGKPVHITTKDKAEDGRKRYKGRVEAVDELSVTLYIEEESTRFVLELGNISKARLEYEF